uniref:Uncharacterized protein n=1 Tax=Calcidiscus leptoporus TaxID=127549 RepID=A0A7S0IVW0_9EUKA
MPLTEPLVAHNAEHSRRLFATSPSPLRLRCLAPVGRGRGRCVWPRQRPAFGPGRGRRLAAGERPRRLDALNDAPTHGFTMPNLPDDMDMPDPEEVELLEVVKYGQPRV